MAAFYGISFRLNLAKYKKFRCGSLIGRISVLRVISPYFGFVLFEIAVGSWRLATTTAINSATSNELGLELVQTQMTQKPMLRAEVYARALRASQNRKEDSV